MRWFRRIFTKQQHNEPEYVEKLLSFTPKNREIYELALTHSSAHIKGKNGENICNERLEFLGDAVISLVVAQCLYEIFPQEGEGALTKRRSQLVKREHLNDVAKKIGLDQYLRVGKGLKNNAEDRLGNALEALVGAIYQDAGLEQASLFIKQHIFDSRDNALTQRKEEDYKSRLLEFGQARHIKIEFVVREEKYDSTNDTHTFYIVILADGKEIAEAAGKTKREAQQTAAKKALSFLKQKKQLIK